MPHADPIKGKEYMKKWREKNKEKIKIDRKIRYGLVGKDEYKKRKPYFTKWQRENREKVKANKASFKQRKIIWLSQHLGGPIRCDRCRYNKSFAALQLHHTDPTQKETYLDGLTRWLNSMSLKRFKEKILITNFLILCANCHAELHAGIWKYGK